MPDTRERLVEILEGAGKMIQFPGTLANILIENGVTILTEPKTNADLIRAMTDEDLAYWIMCPYDSPYCDGTEHNCVECTMEWLKQPAEVE